VFDANIHSATKYILQAKTIVIIRSSSIGDVVLALSVLHMLEKFPVEIDILWFGSFPSLSLVQEFFPNVQGFEIKHLKTLGKTVGFLRKFPKIDLCIDLQVSLRSRFICLLSSFVHGSSTVKLTRRFFQRVFWILVARLRSHRSSMSEVLQQVSVHRYRDMLCTARLGLMKQFHPNVWKDRIRRDFPPRCCLGNSSFRSLNQDFLKDDDVRIVIAPSAKYLSKRLPKEFIVRVIDQIRYVYSGSIRWVLLGDEQDMIFVQQVESDLVARDECVVNFSGKLRLSENLVVLSKCQVLLGSDSSLSHLAELVSTPVAMIFGPTVEAFGFAPWQKSSRAFSSSVGCRPCSRHGEKTCRYKKRFCFKKINTKAVAHFILERLRL